MRPAAFALSAIVAMYVVARAATGAADAPLSIGTVRPDRTEAKVYERVTLELDFESPAENPFDSSQVRVDAEVEPPSGKKWTAPGFLYRPFTRKLEGGRETAEPAGPARWQVRLAMVEPGPHTVVVKATDRRGTVASKPIALTARKVDAAGYVRRAADDFRYFVTDRGESFFPIGANVCWGGGRGTRDYDTWLPKYAANGANYWRAWLAPEWFTFCLNTRASGHTRIDLARAWKLDYAVERSERLGLRILVCIDSFNILRSKRQQHGCWEDSPYIKANGGPCEKPRDYFTDPEMLKAYRDRLRYIVARWGYSTSVFAWEFWNEVDIISDYDSETVATWHARMARHLREIDPWRHLITTSTANHRGDPRVDTLPELDFVQSHHYLGGAEVVATLGGDRDTKKAAQDRPHYHGEFGLGHSGAQTRRDDPTGVHLHNGLFASVGQEQAATPMTWWWDSYVEPANLYPIFGAFARWIDGFDFVAQKPKRLEAEIAYTDPDAAAAVPAGPLAPSEAAWDPAPFNQPATVTVTRTGKVTTDRPLARAMHGLRNHPKLHNPATFRLDVPRATTFGVRIDGVSGYGGARLQITLDSKLVLDEDFADNDAAGTTMNQYDKTYRIDLPAGQHTVKVENTGADWFYLAYEIPWRTAGPPLRALGLVGRTRALVWVQSRHYLWDRVREAKPPAIAGAKLTMTNVQAGAWTVERFDTQAGKVVASEEKTVGSDGRLELALPPIVWDTALRLQRR